MRIDVLALTVLVLAAMTASSSAACSKPEAPACALETIPFAGMQDFDACRMQMLAFRDRMDAYATCLAEAAPADEKAARDEYEDIRVRFNRRARGE